MPLSQSEVTIVPCAYCSRPVRVPSGRVRHQRRVTPERPYVTHCSPKCEREHVAKEGAKQQEEIARGV